jgi:cyclopropane fatty-acyl-phospholipid synthase-like methyltransferase
MAVPQRITWAVEQLAPADRILEIGCGGGHALALIRARYPGAEIVGIDRSALQVARACELNREAIMDGRARVEQLDLLDAPDVLGVFDAVLAINVNEFWTAPAPSLNALSRLLRTGGRAFLVYEPPSVSRLTAVRREISAALGEHGFAVEDLREAAFRASHGVCIIAHP